MYYSEMTWESAVQIWNDACDKADGINPAPKCEYRSPQYDNGTGEGKMIPCRNKAAMWTDRGLRCGDHRRD